MSSPPGPIRRFLRWCAEDIRSGETIDLWALIAAAILFTILGATGIANVQVLSSVVLALLAILAVSQVRTRQETRALISSWRRSRTEVFERAFPSTYYTARERASHSYFFAGMTMQRTLPTIRVHLERILESGGSVRLLLPDPTDRVLMSMVAASRRSEETPQRIAELVKQALTEIETIGSHNKPELRVTSVLPRIGLNILDAGRPGAVMMVQMYQIRPASEPGPIFCLTAEDGYWFDHFRNESEQLWSESHPWPKTRGS